MAKLLSSVDIMFLVAELQQTINAKIDKIFGSNNTEFYFQCHSASKGKFYIIVNIPSALFLSQNKPETPEAPSEICSQLRSTLTGGRIEAVVQKESERIVEFKIRFADKEYLLVLELFSNGNLIVVDNQLVKLATTYHKWSKRTIRPGVKYEYPHREINFKTINLHELRNFIITSKKENIVKKLALDLGIGGTYAEAICLNSNIPKEHKTIDESELQRLLEAITAFNSVQTSPQLIYLDEALVEVSPIDLPQFNASEYTIKNMDSYSAALEFANKIGIELVRKSSFDNQINKTRSIIEEQEKLIRKYGQTEDEQSAIGHEIYLKYAEITDIINQIKKAREKHSWKEIIEKLQGNQIIKEVSEKEGSIIIEIDEQNSTNNG